MSAYCGSPGRHVQRADDVDRTGRDGSLRMLGGGTADHDRCRHGRHDPLDGFEATAEQLEVDEHGRRAGAP